MTTEHAALLIALIALVVSYLSYRASVDAVRASTFDRRFEIYADAERFIGLWLQKGRPEMEALSQLVGAWTRSHFLCREDVTKYLRKVWLDAVEADRLHQSLSDKTAVDRGAASKKKYDLLQEHGDYEKLRKLFMSDLRVQPTHWPTLRGHE